MPTDLSNEIRHSRELLMTASKFVETLESPLRTARLDVHTCEVGLALAAEGLTKRLGPEPDKLTRQHLLMLLHELHQERVSLRDAALRQRSAAVMAVQEALEHLRSASTVQQLLERIPGEICRLGFGRSLVSQVSEGLWTARHAFVDQDDELADLIVRAGSEEPARLTPQLLESELVRRRRPMIVRDPQRNPGMHQQLKLVTKTQGYVAAPVVVCDRVIGFLHADEFLGYERIDDFCRDLLSMFAEGIGYAVERTVFHQRLEALRGTLNDYTQHVNDLVAECASVNVDLSAANGEHAEPVSTAPAAVPIGQFGTDASVAPLTRRELEILRHMASGATNAQIATRLVLSEGTVKSHVKHILRKLTASNRAQAVAYYHQLVQPAR
jgi:DNA-binding CsgD family transcriptional regulator